MRRLTQQDMNQHFREKPVTLSVTSGRFSGAHPNQANAPKEFPKDKVQESRLRLWEALKHIGQARHENISQPVVDTHLKEADEAVREALRLIL